MQKLRVHLEHQNIRCFTKDFMVACSTPSKDQTLTFSVGHGVNDVHATVHYTCLHLDENFVEVFCESGWHALCAIRNAKDFAGWQMVIGEEAFDAIEKT